MCCVNLYFCEIKYIMEEIVNFLENRIPWLDILFPKKDVNVSLFF